MRRSAFKGNPCQRCGESVPEGKMQCPSCREWQISEAAVDGNDGTVLLSDASILNVDRIKTGPWDKCFGGGLVRKSLVLFGGSPGAGKSTLSLQLSDKLVLSTKKEIVYVAAEEILAAIRERALRLKLKNIHRFRMIPMADGFSGSLGTILTTRKPGGIIIDSLSRMTNSNPDDALEACKRLRDYAIEIDAPVIIIDHITKDGDLAGLMALQHEVDTCITLNEYAKGESGRIMTTGKNRFGATGEICFQMTETGLVKCEGCEYCEPEDENEDE